MTFDIKAEMAKIPVGSYLLLRVVEVEEKNEEGEVVKTHRAIHLHCEGLASVRKRAAAVGYILANTALQAGKGKPDQDFETLLSDIVAEFYAAIESADANVSTGTIFSVKGDPIGETDEEVIARADATPADELDNYN